MEDERRKMTRWEEEEKEEESSRWGVRGGRVGVDLPKGEGQPVI